MNAPQSLPAVRQRLESMIEELIEMIDLIDGDPDTEDDDPAEDADPAEDGDVSEDDDPGEDGGDTEPNGDELDTNFSEDGL